MFLNYWCGLGTSLAASTVSGRSLVAHKSHLPEDELNKVIFNLANLYQLFTEKIIKLPKIIGSFGKNCFKKIAVAARWKKDLDLPWKKVILPQLIAWSLTLSLFRPFLKNGFPGKSWISKLFYNLTFYYADIMNVYRLIIVYFFVFCTMKWKRRIISEFAAGCARVSGGCIAYHGALQYYALQTQQFNTIYLHADKRFRPFVIDGMSYEYHPLKFTYNILAAKDMDGTPFFRDVLVADHRGLHPPYWPGRWPGRTDVCSVVPWQRTVEWKGPARVSGGIRQRVAVEPGRLPSLFASGPSRIERQVFKHLPPQRKRRKEQD